MATLQPSAPNARATAAPMPEDAPGSLPDQEYVDVVAYILELNGHDAGEGELSATEESLGQLPVDPSDTGNGATPVHWLEPSA